MNRLARIGASKGMTIFSYKIVFFFTRVKNKNKIFPLTFCIAVRKLRTNCLKTRNTTVSYFDTKWK